MQVCVFYVSYGTLAAAGEWKVIDFGLARRYLDEAGEVLPERHDTAFRGSTTYASVFAHAGQDLGRRDDLWSWFYCVVEMVEGECGLGAWRGMCINQVCVRVGFGMGGIETTSGAASMAWWRVKGAEWGAWRALVLFVARQIRWRATAANANATCRPTESEDSGSDGTKGMIGNLLAHSHILAGRVTGVAAAHSLSTVLSEPCCVARR